MSGINAELHRRLKQLTIRRFPLKVAVAVWEVRDNPKATWRNPRCNVVLNWKPIHPREHHGPTQPSCSCDRTEIFYHHMEDDTDDIATTAISLLSATH